MVAISLASAGGVSTGSERGHESARQEASDENSYTSHDMAPQQKYARPKTAQEIVAEARRYRGFK
jgi:hypothetical protein